MAIELQVVSVTALVTSEPRQRQTYDGRGDDRKATGRAMDGSGRPLSSVSAVVMAEPIGLLPDATVQLPDSQMTGLVPGAVVRLDGQLTVRLSGGDYAAIRATVTGERIEPLGRWADWISTAVSGKGKAGEPRGPPDGSPGQQDRHQLGSAPRSAAVCVLAPQRCGGG